MRFTILKLTLPAALLAVAVGSSTVHAQEARNEQFYYPGSFNWQFLTNYPEGARLFNAFDYGHAVLYERLYTKTPEEQVAALEKEYRYLTTDLLVRPPRFAVAEEAVEPRYARLAWHAKQMFDWAHVLHRQIYDVYSDARIPPAQKDSLIERLTDYYLTRKDYAFVPVPKSMALMDDQSFSQTFRKRHVKFNGLIWAYHWLQVGLYEPYLVYHTPVAQKAGVAATIARFWSLLDDAPSRMPAVMPMTAAVAPRFAAAHPRAAVIFDNLHMMHDIISDVLASDEISHARKREAIYAQLAEFRDSTKNTMSLDEWRMMGDMMGGVGRMGGPAVGVLVPLEKAAPGMKHDMKDMPRMDPRKDTTHMQHGAPPARDTTPMPPRHHIKTER